jgi:putative acetyltransferase
MGVSRVVVRPAGALDVGLLAAVHSAAFGQPDEAVLVTALVVGGYDRVSLVAEVDGRLVGHVLLTELGLASPLVPPNSPSLRSLALAPLATLPEHQRQGIGSQLVRASLEAARCQGWRLVFVLGAPEYYGRFGFSAGRAARFACSYACSSFMAIALHPDAVEEGRLEYPRPFGEL